MNRRKMIISKIISKKNECQAFSQFYCGFVLYFKWLIIFYFYKFLIIFFKKFIISLVNAQNVTTIKTGIEAQKKSCISSCTVIGCDKKCDDNREETSKSPKGKCTKTCNVGGCEEKCDK